MREAVVRYFQKSLVFLHSTADDQRSGASCRATHKWIVSLVGPCCMARLATGLPRVLSIGLGAAGERGSGVPVWTWRLENTTTINHINETVHIVCWVFLRSDLRCRSWACPFQPGQWWLGWSVLSFVEGDPFRAATGQSACGRQCISVAGVRKAVLRFAAVASHCWRASCGCVGLWSLRRRGRDGRSLLCASEEFCFCSSCP